MKIKTLDKFKLDGKVACHCHFDGEADSSIEMIKKLGHRTVSIFGDLADKTAPQKLIDETRNRQILERIPAGRWSNADDLAGAAVFLSSAASRLFAGSRFGC